MNQLSNFFKTEIQGREGTISIDEKDLLGFTNKAKIKSFELNHNLKKWENEKTLQVQKLIICIFYTERYLERFTIDGISYLLTKFVSVDKPIFGIYKNDKLKRIKITLIFE